MNELILLDHFSSFLKFWWIAIIATLLGALLGILFSQFHPPIYEATATLMVTVDLNKAKENPLEYQEEEMALFNLQVALLAHPTITQLIDAANQRSIRLDPAALYQNYAYERKMSFGELRYRDADPTIAQTVANLWIEETQKTFNSMQADGEIPAYVVIQGVTPAELPQIPIAYRLTTLILAGGVIGLVSGILLVEILGKNLQRKL